MLFGVLLLYRRRCENRGLRSRRHGRRRDHDHLGRRGVHRLDDPKHCDMRDHREDQRPESDRHDVPETHLFERYLLSRFSKPQMSAELDARIDGLYRVVKGRIDWSNLIPTCLELAKELEQMSELRGAERLSLLQSTLKHALKESELSTEEKETVLGTIDTVVPIAMQAAILASKSPVLGQIQATCCAWMKK